MKNSAELSSGEVELFGEAQRYVNVKYVARRFGVSIATVWRWTQQGRLPKPVKFGDSITRWLISDLILWENQLRGAECGDVEQ